MDRDDLPFTKTPRHSEWMDRWISLVSGYLLDCVRWMGRVRVWLWLFSGPSGNSVGCVRPAERSGRDGAMWARATGAMGAMDLTLT